MGDVTKRETNGCRHSWEIWGNIYDLACIDEIHDTLLIPYTDMDHLRVCVVIAEEHSETIHYPVGEPYWKEVKQAKIGRSE